MSRTTSTLQNRRSESFQQNAVVLRAFREHLKALSKPKCLDLLVLADLRPVTNADVRRTLGLGARGSAWRRLSSLTTLAMLDKREDGYRLSTYGKELVASIASVFQGAVKGRWELPGADRKASEELLRFAKEGTEALYQRGRIDQAEYEKRKKLISEAGAALA